MTRQTLKYHALPWWSGVGILVTAMYLSTLLYFLAIGQFRLAAFWLLIMVVYVVERVVTVSSREVATSALAGLLIVEMPYDITLQLVQAKAFFAALFRTRKSW